ncbi:MAG TPA: glycosyltransferase family 2 protein [Verrucomicrobiae bacterium]|jgi:glycosyltransferase involved in cell wall biosynthesis
MTVEPRLPISVCIIAGNEAARIARALESIASWTTEIIVVLNDEVNDGTDKIAESFGAKVFREPWKGYIGQKNSVADKAGQPWILNLDADEVVTPELRNEIFGRFAGGNSSSTAFSFPRCTFYLGRWIRHGDWYPDHCIRLWQRGRARWAGIDPHAKLIVDGRIDRLKNDLHHFSNDSVNAHIQKIIPFTDEFVRQHSQDAPDSQISGLMVRPGWRFIRAYFFRLGFLDGWQGLFIAWLNAFSTAAKYAKLREHQSRAAK